MRRFIHKPDIYEFDTVDAFAGHFGLGDGDLIFTERFLHEKYLRGRVNCDAMFHDDYGLGEPSDVIIDRMLADLHGRPVKRIVGIGGGAILDITKLLCIKDATTVSDMFADRIPLVRDKEMLLVPTTCGTGAEVTCVSVVDMVEQQTKIGKRIDANFADGAVLVTEFLDSIPAGVFLNSSGDALVHAMEIFVATTGNTYSDLFSKEAIRIIVSHYQRLREEGVDARFKYIQEFQRASTLAGIALANTLCGAVHAMAMHFGSAHHVPHGEATVLFLMGVFKRYNALGGNDKLAELAAVIKDSLGFQGDDSLAFEALDDLLRTLMSRKSLSDYGMQAADIPAYADKVIASQQRLLVNNCLPLDRNDLIHIYESLY